MMFYSTFEMYRNKMVSNVRFFCFFLYNYICLCVSSRIPHFLITRVQANERTFQLNTLVFLLRNRTKRKYLNTDLLWPVAIRHFTIYLNSLSVEHLDWDIVYSVNYIKSLLGVCSHLRACEFWTASIYKPDVFRTFSYKERDAFLKGKTDHLLAYPMGIAAGPDMPQDIYFVEDTDEWRKLSKTMTTLKDSIW